MTDHKSFEHSESPEEKETRESILELDALIAEAKHEIEELKRERQETVEYNKFAKENGFQEQDIAWIDEAEKDYEEGIVQLEKQKQQFLEIAFRFDKLQL